MPPKRDPVLDAMVELRIHAKTQRKEATRAEQATKDAKSKSARALKTGQVSVARIHASSSTRHAHRHLECLKKAAVAEELAQDIRTTLSTRDDALTMAKATRAMEAAAKVLNVEKTLSITQGYMNRSEDMKIAGQALGDAAGALQMQSGEEMGEGAEETQRLLEQIADEVGVDLKGQLESSGQQVPQQELQNPVENQKGAAFEDSLAGRLRGLRG